MKKNYSFFKNASYALMGVKALLKESAFKIELCLAIPLAVISLFIKASKAEHILLIGVLLLVLAAEAFNTAIEACVDLNTQKWHKEAKLAKDCGSAGVFFCLLLGGLTWMIVILF